MWSWASRRPEVRERRCVAFWRNSDGGLTQFVTCGVPCIREGTAWWDGRGAPVTAARGAARASYGHGALNLPREKSARWGISRFSGGDAVAGLGQAGRAVARRRGSGVRQAGFRALGGGRPVDPVGKTALGTDAWARRRCRGTCVAPSFGSGGSRLPLARAVIAGDGGSGVGARSDARFRYGRALHHDRR